uniref:Uncharacterized protein n=1 Tax=Podoviridae sp. ct5bO8 TaxID=2825219 RepID=A0A8S5PIX8_9CAUD|nr:MAG TPA: hypothetical protein [Podoviridae sp. ct5bO8]
MKKSIENALSEDEQRMVLQGLLSRKIWRFYELLAKWAPIPLMLWHWYGVWDYGHCPRPTILDTNDNGNCIIWIYFLAYIYMPLCMLPVSFFFRYCWIFRIPFLYFFGINAIRLYYQHWLITPEQLEMHHVFIIFTLILYAYGFIKIAITRSKCRIPDVSEWRMRIFGRRRENRTEKSSVLDGKKTSL